MEFLPTKRFRKIRNPFFPSFSQLRNLMPVQITMDLQLHEDHVNLEYLDNLAERGYELFPVERVPVKDSHKRPIDFPLRVLFEMTSICNARCMMCPQRNLKRKLMHMDKKKYMSILDELESYGIEGLWLYHFGESLTHPNFEEILDYINTKKRLGNIWLSTNGILANEQMIDFLLGSSLSYLNFSLQSISLENYKKIAPTSPAEIILANLQTLINKKKKRLGFKPYFRLQIIEQKCVLDEIDTYLKKFYDKCDLISVNMIEHTDLAFNKQSKNLRKHQKRRKCLRLLRSDCFINSDGTITICDNAYNHQLDIGNLWHNTLYEIWNSQERRRILKMNQDGTIWNNPLCAECLDYDL